LKQRKSHGEIKFEFRLLHSERRIGKRKGKERKGKERKQRSRGRQGAETDIDLEKAGVPERDDRRLKERRIYRPDTR